VERENGKETPVSRSSVRSKRDLRGMVGRIQGRIKKRERKTEKIARAQGTRAQPLGDVGVGTHGGEKGRWWGGEVGVARRK